MSTETDIRGLVRSGVWDNNIPMVQMLGLCPALAVTTSATNGLGMALATGLVLVTTNVMIACVRSLIAPDVRIPALIVLIATVVTSVDLIMNAWLHDLYKVLGIFIPLIVTNCAILGRAESFASKQPPGVAFVDGLAMAVGFAWVLVVLGALRELLGSGRLFANASDLLGPAFASLEMQFWRPENGVLLAVLPPGAFIIMGLMLAAKNRLGHRFSKQASRSAPGMRAST